MTNCQAGLGYQYRKSTRKERRQFLQEEIWAALEEMRVIKLVVIKLAECMHNMGRHHAAKSHMGRHLEHGLYNRICFMTFMTFYQGPQTCINRAMKITQLVICVRAEGHYNIS